jgi:hypothetical protein
VGPADPAHTNVRKSVVTGQVGRDDEHPCPSAADAYGVRALSWSAAASLVAGLGALGFLTLGRFAVGLGEFAPMAHVWTVWSVAAATVGFGAQIETIDLRSRRRGVFSARHIRLGVIGVAIAGLTTFIWRDTLFGTSSWFWPLVCASIPVGSLVTGLARGTLAADNERVRLALVIAGENLVRFGIVVALWWVGATPQLLALALLAGFSVALIGLSSARGDLRGNLGSDSGVSSGSAGAIAGLIAHATLVLPPTVLALRGESPEVVAAVFLVLTYLRAPYQFLLGMSPVITARSFAGRPSEGWSAWLHDGRRTATAAGLAMIAAAMFGYVASGPITDLMLGGTEVISSIDFAVLCSLVVAVTFAIVRTIYVLPDRGPIFVVRSWGVAAAIAAVFALIPGSPTVLFAGLLFGMVLCLVQVTFVASARFT